jgi:hypothetical protein
MLRRVNGDRKSLLDSIVDLIASLGACVRNVFVLPTLDRQTAPTTDPDFEEWLRNDVKVVVDPSHRYGGDVSGFLADSELENPRRSTAED